MKVPLQVYQKKVDGMERLVVWFNKQKKIVEPPIYPYFYSYEKLNLPKATKVEKVEATALSSNQVKTFYKYIFNNTDDLAESRISGLTFEDNIPFIIRCRIDSSDFFVNFPNTNKLKFLFLDIEQENSGKLFPTPEEKIVSISYATNDKKVKCIYLDKAEKSDERILKEFIEEFKKIDPDVVVYYNKKYDFPRILQRCERLGIDTSVFSRSGEKPYIGGRYYLNIDGRIIYDVFDSVSGDQALNGKVKSRSLKDVAKYFGFKVIEVDRGKIDEIVGTKKLVEYNVNDVELLLQLFQIYFPVVYEMANDLKIPLNESAILNITDLSSILIGENFVKRGIVADGVNADRFPEIYSDKSGYQGALVGIKKTGLFRPVFKADYSSMYPNIMANFNLSSDTTVFIGFEPLGSFRIEEDKEWFTYSIPDTNLGQNVLVRVYKKEGFITKLVKQLLEERMVYKRKYKETGDKKYSTLSWIAKVKANGGLYGTQGAKHHPFGYAPIAVATTGIGRECVKLLMEVLEELYPNSVIEYDTDGVYFTTKKLDEKTVLSVFQTKVKERFKKEVKFDIDFDKYDAGYFYKAKNYILRKGDDVILHGAALNAKNKDTISAKFIEEISKAKIEGKPIDKIVKKFYDFKGFKLEDFAMSFTLSKPLKDYKGESSVGYRLAKRAKEKLGLEPEVGNIYYYVKTVYGYELLQLVKFKDLDFRYYQEKLNRILDIFKTEEELQKSIHLIEESPGYDLPEFKEEVKENGVKSLKDFF